VSELSRGEFAGASIRFCLFSEMHFLNSAFLKTNFQIGERCPAGLCGEPAGESHQSGK
jgi:hypothetical protein